MLPVGAPAPHLARGRHAALRSTNAPRWKAFRRAWGAGWAARWDPRTGTPRFLWAPGVAVGRADELVQDIAVLAGIDPTELVATKPVVRADRTWLRWTRRWQGAPVEGDEILLSVQQERIGGVWVRLTPFSGLDIPLPGELVRPLPTWTATKPGTGPADGVSAHLVTRTEANDVVTYTDRAGTMVYRYSTRHHDDVQVSHLARTIGDPYIESPARQLYVEDLGGGTDTTADDGSHSLSGDLLVFLDGPALEIRKDGAVQSPRELSPDGSGVTLLRGGEDLSKASASVLHHAPLTFDWLADRWPSHAWLGEKVYADVDISSSACNAYYTSGTINFYVGYEDSCYNFGRIADVIYHEIGHGIHHYILAGGTFAGDVSEGSADYVSATINGDPIVGLNSNERGDFVRELETDRVYPDDAIGQVHNDGRIWGSFLWNLRSQWVAADGETVGTERADRVFLGALEQGPTLTDLHEAVILADDDDGDLSNGTPHACELVTLLEQHGLGPGPLGVVVLEHDPLGPQSSAARNYPVSFDFFNPTKDCSDFDPDAVQLYYSTGPLDVVPGVGDAREDDPSIWDDWEPLPLTFDATTGTTWSGVLPRQLATTQVHYFIEARTSDGAEVFRTHGGTLEGVYSFRVGDREAVWCEDFEGGEPADWVHGGGFPWEPDAAFADQWEVAEPVAGEAFVPESAASGSFVMGTNVAGLYEKQNRQSLSSPPIPVPEGRMALLTWQRFLTVEDGRYDRAEWWIDDMRVFRNRSSDSGSDHMLDTDWNLVEVELASLPPQVIEDGSVVLHWTLQSDAGLEFGGWHLDDVCVVQLGDIPGHYRRMQLTAELDAEFRVQVAWENPWIEPLDTVRLVAASGDTLEEVGTATTLLELVDATPGGAGSYFDSLPLAPGESRTYAIVARADPEEAFQLDLADGENRVTVSREADPEPGDTAAPGDTGASDTELDPTDTGRLSDADGSGTPAAGKRQCGCAVGDEPAGFRWLVWLAPLAWLRRRR